MGFPKYATDVAVRQIPNNITEMKVKLKNQSVLIEHNIFSVL